MPSVLITGGTGGLGLCVAEQLAAQGWHVVITGRDGERAAALAATFGGEGLALELGSLADVRRFAREFGDGERPALGTLICNGALQLLAPGQLSADGYEATFAVNHLGHFLLVNLLLEQLVTPAKVIVVASDVHDPKNRNGMPAPRYTSAKQLAQLDPAWAQGDSAATAGKRRYATSKLCNVLFAYEAQRRLGEQGVSIDAFDPGMMPGTGLARDYPRYQQLAWNYLLPVLTLVGRNVHTPRQSARALAQLVREGTGGAYYSGMRAIPSSAQSYDWALAQDLWETSLALCAAH